MSPGAQLQISDGGWLRGRSVEFSADASGNITRRYLGRFLRTGHRSRRAGSGSSQIAAAVHPAERASARRRAPRAFSRRRAPPGLLGEITQHRRWLGEEDATSPSSSDEHRCEHGRQALEQAGREISSDYELASLLIESGERLLTDEATRRRTSTPLEDRVDYEMRRVFSSGLSVVRSRPSSWHRCSTPATTLTSDYEHGVSADAAGEAAIDRAGQSPVLCRAVDHRERLRAPPRAQHAGRPVRISPPSHGDHAQIRGRISIQTTKRRSSCCRFPATRSKARSALHSSLRSSRSAGLTNAAACCRRPETQRLSEESVASALRAAGTMPAGYERRRSCRPPPGTTRFPVRTRVYIKTADRLGRLRAVTGARRAGETRKTIEL